MWYRAHVYAIDIKKYITELRIETPLVLLRQKIVMRQGFDLLLGG